MSKKHPSSKARAGFTLLELLVVIVIIGLLAAYVGPRYFSQLEKSKRETTKAQLQAFGEALDAYRIDNGTYPSTEEGLDALEKNVANLKTWSGPYLKKAIPSDPWGNRYIYERTSDEDFNLYSTGGKATNSDQNTNRAIYYQ
ncbi:MULTISPECIES: type II secretion system major pseudopilin GspG [Candidatus Ichthyocystis]|uniref:Type II secretion system core protein G n=1 Tax=Candidatus Ichthyocystis hellenicum TaxID=1561003 RepID=A0A0S4M2Q5_9BURK|nr:MULTISPECIES: type II secretion system major pseudopilin GspG [Ichthyocystis]CUT17295.1 type II secretion system protein G [Candidatus Ichthyocystis hellenicum]